MRPGKVIEQLPEVTTSLLDITEINRQRAADIHISRSDIPIHEIPRQETMRSVASSYLVNGEVQDSQARVESDMAQLDELKTTVGSGLFGPAYLMVWDAREESLGALVRITGYAENLRGVEKYEIGSRVKRLAKLTVAVTIEQHSPSYLDDLEEHLEKHLDSYEKLRPFTHRSLRKRIKHIKSKRISELATRS